MKNFIKFFIIFFCLNIYGQAQWQPLSSAVLNTNGTRFDDVFFLNDTLGWAVNGATAAVFKTTDGGATWTNQLNEAVLGINTYFRNIEFLNENIGFVGTLTNNKFYKTTDGGATWSEITNTGGIPRAVCGLDCVGTTTVYGCGSYMNVPPFVIKSTDSGVTWQYIDMSAYATGLVEVLFLDEYTGYVSGRNNDGGVILKTTDGGQTWSQIFNSGLSGEYVWKLQVLSNNTNIIFGSIESVSPTLGKLIKSTDGGNSWVSRNAPESEIQAVGFLDENHGWMGGHATGFYETFDAGLTWTNMNIGSNLNRIFILRNDLAYASGSTLYKFSPVLNNNHFEEKPRMPLKVNVFPNPVINKLNLEINFQDADYVMIELYDALGKRIGELQQLDVATNGKKILTYDFLYPAGVYYLNLHSNTGRQSLKVVKN